MTSSPDKAAVAAVRQPALYTVRSAIRALSEAGRSALKEEDQP